MKCKHPPTRNKKHYKKKHAYKGTQTDSEYNRCIHMMLGRNVKHAGQKKIPFHVHCNQIMKY